MANPYCQNNPYACSGAKVVYGFSPDPAQLQRAMQHQPQMPVFQQQPQTNNPPGPVGQPMLFARQPIQVPHQVSALAAGLQQQSQQQHAQAWMQAQQHAQAASAQATAWNAVMAAAAARNPNVVPIQGVGQHNWLAQWPYPGQR